MAIHLEKNNERVKHLYTLSNPCKYFYTLTQAKKILIPMLYLNTRFVRVVYMISGVL